MPRLFQVITRIQGISLSPEKPEYTGSTWELAGQKTSTLLRLPCFGTTCITLPKATCPFETTDDVGDPSVTDRILYQDRQNWNWYKQPAHQRYKTDEVEAISKIFGFDPTSNVWRPFTTLRCLYKRLAKWLSHKGRLITFPTPSKCRTRAVPVGRSTKASQDQWW